VDRIFPACGKIDFCHGSFMHRPITDSMQSFSHGNCVPLSPPKCKIDPSHQLTYDYDSEKERNVINARREKWRGKSNPKSGRSSGTGSGRTMKEGRGSSGNTTMSSTTFDCARLMGSTWRCREPVRSFGLASIKRRQPGASCKHPIAFSPMWSALVNCGSTNNCRGVENDNLQASLRGKSAREFVKPLSGRSLPLDMVSLKKHKVPDRLAGLSRLRPGRGYARCERRAG